MADDDVPPASPRRPPPRHATPPPPAPLLSFPPPADEALDLFLDWVASRGIDLWDHQEEALLDLASGNHVILGTPTGSGKSLVALGMCFMAVCTNRRAYYTAPIKALVSEKFFDLVELLGRDNVGMITGDAVINAGAPVICCTAEILANDALRFGPEADVGCVAMDEFHFYGDRDRGWAWQVPLLTLPNVQFLLMSATLGDISAIIAGLLERADRPPGGDRRSTRRARCPWLTTMWRRPLEATVELALRAGKAPIYIVHFSQDAALKSATSLASYGVSTKEQREAIKEAIAGTRFTTAFGKTLKRLLLAGVGVHHAGMLPRYRLLVEKLAQQGLLPVICGTDTLGVGINVPIHTVLLTALAKFDGHAQRRLNAREFHQIAGRAGRAGFDTEGVVIAQATEYDIENARALAKAGGDPKKARKIKTKQPPEGFVGWKEATFDKLVAAEAEPLRPRMRVSHSMVLAEVEQGGDAFERVRRLIDDSAPDRRAEGKLHARADEVFATLMDAGWWCASRAATGGDDWYADGRRARGLRPRPAALALPAGGARASGPGVPRPTRSTSSRWPRPRSRTPTRSCARQERAAKDAAMQQMKAEGVEYDERIQLIQDVTYPKPLEDLIEPAFAQYCREVPWANDYHPRPKSVLRDMVETASDFKGYVQRCGIARSEGTLLRYLSDAYRVLDRTVPLDKRDERFDDIVHWLGLVVRTVDSSLVDEWSGATAPASSRRGPPRRRTRWCATVAASRCWCAMPSLPASAWRRAEDVEELGELDAEWGWREPRWRAARRVLRGARGGPARRRRPQRLPRHQRCGRAERPRVARAPDLPRPRGRP